MLSKFGQLVRTLRLQKSVLLSQMASDLEVSASYLSAVEFGRRAVPKDWPEKITAILELGDTERKMLEDAALSSTAKSTGVIKFELEELNPLQQEVAVEFAKKIGVLTEIDLQEIKNKLLEDRYSEQNWNRGSR